MAQNKKEKLFWRKYFGFDDQQFKNISNKANRIKLRDTEIDDNGLDWLTSKITSINQLDLDNTDITDSGIEFLMRLKYLRELRLKGCFGLTNECLKTINQIYSLELLHLGRTNITIEDISQNITNQNLKQLLLSSSLNESEIQRQVEKLKTYLPNCVINVNYIEYN